MDVDPFRNLLNCMVAAAVLSLCGATDADSKILRASDVHARLAKAPLSMFLAKGDKDACGPGCDTWIAVEGQFDEGAAQRFAAFVRRLENKSVPVFLNSPGGLTDEGLALGRFLRDHGIRAGIARSAATCGGAPECKAQIAAGRPVPATWNSRDAVCSSACVFALLGATERAIPDGVKIGVHATAYFCFGEDGRELRPVGSSKDAVECRSQLSVRMQQLARYIADMGISRELVAVIDSVPSSRIRFLTRDEIRRFRIETKSDRASLSSR